MQTEQVNSESDDSGDALAEGYISLLSTDPGEGGHIHFFKLGPNEKCIKGMQSKKISNDQELIQSNPRSCLKTKRETTKYIN